MFDRTEIIVGLEIGTAKVCAVVGELSEDEGLHVIGLGQSPTAGAVRKGEIINAEVAEDAVRAARAEMQRAAQVRDRHDAFARGPHVAPSAGRGMSI